MAYGAQVNGIECLEFFNGRVGQGFAGSQVPFAAKVVGDGFKVEDAGPGDSVYTLKTFRDNFRSRTVAWDDCDLVGQRAPPMG